MAGRDICGALSEILRSGRVPQKRIQRRRAERPAETRCGPIGNRAAKGHAASYVAGHYEIARRVDWIGTIHQAAAIAARRYRTVADGISKRGIFRRQAHRRRNYSDQRRREHKQPSLHNTRYLTLFDYMSGYSLYFGFSAQRSLVAKVSHRLRSGLLTVRKSQFCL
jgi:hypothetical protein